MNGTKVSFILVPGLDQKIRQLAVEMAIIAPDDDDSLEQILELMLPDLVDNALAGDRPAPSLQDPPDMKAEEENEVNIAAAVAAAAAEVEDINIAEEKLEIKDPPPAEEVEDERPMLAWTEASPIVHNQVYSWANGNPLKEKAVCETLSGMPRDMWDWERVRLLAERTYNMKYLNQEGQA